MSETKSDYWANMLTPKATEEYLAWLRSVTTSKSAEPQLSEARRAWEKTVETMFDTKRVERLKRKTDLYQKGERLVTSEPLSQEALIASLTYALSLSHEIVAMVESQVQKLEKQLADGKEEKDEKAYPDHILDSYLSWMRLHSDRTSSGGYK